VDDLRGDKLGRNREVAFVLTILVVNDHHHLPLADVLYRLLDGGERSLERAHARAPNRRSTYFASTATSRFTVVPGSASPKLVRSSVSGIRDTVKDRSSSSATVSETPSTAMEPFSTT